jgi:hypothetical protein
MADPVVEKELQHDTKDGTIARLAQDRTKFKGLFAKATSERNATRAELVKAQADLVEARKAGGAVEELAALKIKVKLDGHRSKFDELARAAGVKPNALNDLWAHSGYKADGDTPDENAMAAAIEKQQTERDYLFGEPAPAGDGRRPADMPPEPEQQARPAVGRGQGGTQRATGSQTQISDAQARDPVWCRANQAKLAKAAADVMNLPTSQVGTKFTIL